MNKTIGTLLLVCFLALSNGVLLAQAKQRLRVLHTTDKSSVHVPPQEAPAGLQIIYGNLGKSQTNLYNNLDGGGVAGPGCNQIEFAAMPFTPKSNSHVSQVRVPVQYTESGANQVNLSIYADASGIPGTLLAGPVTVTNLPLWGTCCTLTTASFSPVAVNGGTQYWVVGDTPLTGTGSDSCVTWDFVARGFYPMGFNLGSGWRVEDFFLDELAGEVLGTIP